MSNTINIEQETNVKMTGDNGAAASLDVNLSNGALDFDMPLAGQHIKAIMDSMKELMNLGADVQAVVNGKTVGPEHVVEAGDQVEFAKPSGTKGC